MKELTFKCPLCGVDTKYQKTINIATETGTMWVCEDCVTLLNKRKKEIGFNRLIRKLGKLTFIFYWIFDIRHDKQLSTLNRFYVGKYVNKRTYDFILKHKLYKETNDD